VCSENQRLARLTAADGLPVGQPQPFDGSIAWPGPIRSDLVPFDLIMACCFGDRRP